MVPFFFGEMGIFAMKYLMNLEKGYLLLQVDVCFFGEAEVRMPPDDEIKQDKVMQMQLALRSDMGTFDLAE
jgi:hypothetical protein